MNDRQRAARKAIAALNEFLLVEPDPWPDEERAIKVVLAIMTSYANAPERPR
jgi:hypothetical protein